MTDVREAQMTGLNSDGARVRRPLSPHLQVYRPQITTTLSIFHRIAGIGLALGSLLFTWWLAAAASSNAAYAVAAWFLGSIIGWILIIGFTLALWFHFCNGIRFLVLDTGRGFEKPQFHKSGICVVVVAIILTVATLVAGGLMR